MTNEIQAFVDERFVDKSEVVIFENFEALEKLIDERLPSKVDGLDGYTYAVEYPNGFVKIGSSSDVVRRIRQLSSNAGGYFNVSLGAVAVTPPFPGFRTWESVLHSRFEDCRVAGTELFEISLEDVAATMDETNFHATKEEREIWELKAQLSLDRLKLSMCLLPGTSLDFVVRTCASICKMDVGAFMDYIKSDEVTQLLVSSQ